MKSLRTFKVIYVGPTNFRSAKIKLIDLWYQTVIKLSYDYDERIVDTAINHLNKLGIQIEATSFDKKDSADLLMTSDFNTQLIK